MAAMCLPISLVALPVCVASDLTSEATTVTVGKVSEISTVICDAIERHLSATQDIARYAGDAGGRTAEVARNISSVSHKAYETGTASAQVLSATQALSRDVSKLSGEVEKFPAAPRAAA